MPDRPVADLEVWFVRRGVPHFIHDYSARTDIWTRAFPILVLAYLGERAIQTPDRLEHFEVFSWITILVITAMGGIVMFATTLPGFHKVPKATDDIGSPTALGFAFLRQHLVPFEATSLVLLVGAVGAVILAKRAVMAEGGR